MGRDADPFTNLRGVQESVKLYQSAMVEYGKEHGLTMLSILFDYRTWRCGAIESLLCHLIT